MYAVFNFLMIVWMSWCFFFLNDEISFWIGLPKAGNFSAHVYSDSYIPWCPLNSCISKQTAIHACDRQCAEATYCSGMFCCCLLVGWLWSDIVSLVRMCGQPHPLFSMCVCVRIPSPLAYHVFAVAMTSWRCPWSGNSEWAWDHANNVQYSEFSVKSNSIGREM
jgi:hypothetical protein